MDEKLKQLFAPSPSPHVCGFSATILIYLWLVIQQNIIAEKFQQHAERNFQRFSIAIQRMTLVTAQEQVPLIGKVSSPLD